MAEPAAAQGFDWAWKLAFVLFSQTKLWIYKILSAVVAIPLALIWAMVFALLTVVHVWILSPALRLLDLILAVVKKVRFTIELIFFTEYCHLIMKLNRYLYLASSPLFNWV